MTNDEVHSSFTLIKTHLMSLCSQREPGSLLPSVRQLAHDFQASPVTVSKVIAELSLEGFVDARPGHGTFVRERRTDWRDKNFDWQSLVLGTPPASSMNNLVMEAPSGCLNFANGYMDDSLLPERELARASARVLRRSTAWQRAPLGGLFELQKWFADRAFAGFPAGDVLIVQGGQAALGIAIRAIVPAGGTLLVESPSYLGPLVIARSAGIKLAPVPVDAEGMRADHLKAALERGPVQAIYLQPNFSNPSGVSLSDQRRLDIVELAREHNTFIIEDDYARDLSFTGQVPAPLFEQDEGHVVYVRSLTKSVAPSLRVAALCAQGPVLSRLRSALLVNDFFVPRPLQEIAFEFLASSSYKKHLTKLQTTFQARMSLACALVDRRLPGCRVHPPEGGYSLWVSLPDAIDEDALCRAAEERGVIVNPGHWWFAAEPVGKHLRLSIAGLTEADLPTAVARLAAAMKELRGVQGGNAC